MKTRPFLKTIRLSVRVRGVHLRTEKTYIY